MKILLLGKNGQLGWELQRSLALLGELVAVGKEGIGSTHADLSRPESIGAIVREVAPQIIVNAAAYTAVDKAESEPELARAVNATSVGMSASVDEDGLKEVRQGVKDLPLSADVWVDRLIVVDLVYRQNGTPLVRLARSRGAVCVDGLDVLVHQGAASFRLWAGMEAPLGAMRSAAKY